MPALSLKWGDALSMVLPGTVALLAIRPYVSQLEDWVDAIPTAGSGLGLGLSLIVAATLAGGVLEAVTRIGWERFLVSRKRSQASPLEMLSRNPNLLDLYERGVQVVYKWATFYANMGTATLLLLLSQLHCGPDRLSVANAALVFVVAIMFRASWVQWGVFVNYQDKVFGSQCGPSLKGAKMLKNDPPPDTPVLILHGMTMNVPTGTVGRLLKRGGYEVDHPDDLFEVEVIIDQRRLVMTLRRCNMRLA